MNKVIHYCWFGNKPLPKRAKKCIKSWRKYLPGYEIKEWNESNFDFSQCRYAQEAYEAKKWAFVSDYARFKIIHDNGGVYFDTDVEVIKPMDEIITKGPFMGVESIKLGPEGKIKVNPGLGIMADKENEFYKEILEIYNTLHFKNPDGTYNLTTILEYTTNLLFNKGLKIVSDIQEINGIVIYPKDYFNPKNMDTGKIEVTQNTISIHHFDASWEKTSSILKGRIYQFIHRCFGEKIAKQIQKIFGRKK